MSFCSDMKSFRSPGERLIMIAVSARPSAPCLFAQNNENHLKIFFMKF